ncbi:MAG: NAD(P)-dependent glycerol-3-phosphate dehydrogenase [Deltaproteobacteria bacterium]|nr:MAG: NAD(P)-dependent glycerol-3-phosphate dehydrogenase [Deltaproteobacteria bacterium]
MTLRTSEEENRVAVVGAGSWGTAVAIALAPRFERVTLWARSEGVYLSLRDERVNRVYLPESPIPENVYPTMDLEEAVKGAAIVLFAVPTQYTRGVAREAGRFMKKGQIAVSLSKGIENETLLTVSRILAEELPAEVGGDISVLSGPTFAKEVAQGKPAAATIASKRRETASYLIERLSTPVLRFYGDTDVIGVEVAGAVKNVIAIATGMADGLGYGLNARAAIITRGLAEIRRLGVALGAEKETFYGLSGMGDLILTCTGDLSRNRTFGRRVGQGEKPEEILKSSRMVVEGVRTSLSVMELRERVGVEMPISEQVYHILHEGKEPTRAVRDLLSRTLKMEKEE